MLDVLVRMAEQLRFELPGWAFRFAPADQVQGALLEVDRYWYRSWVREMAWRYGPGPWWWQIEDDDRFLEWIKEHEAARLDFDYRPKDWNDHCKSMGYGEDASPFVIRVILHQPSREQPVLKGSKELPLAELPRRFSDHPVVYEQRPRATGTARFMDVLNRTAEYFGLRDRPNGQAAPSIGRAEPNTAGTLGGYLRCPVTGRSYLVSCAHVLGLPMTKVYHPGPFEGHGSTEVGEVRFAEIPIVNSMNTSCNGVATADAGRLDVAVAEIHPPHTSNPIEPVSIAHRLRQVRNINTYQQVFFDGKVSGRVQAQINAVTIWMPIDLEDYGVGRGQHCFGNIFQLAPQDERHGHVAQSGDSGAWILDRYGDLNCWNGILIAKQGRYGYGCYAEYVLDACKASREFPGGLALFV